MFGKIRHIHFIGIGGAGMSGIALILHNLGYQVTGSDIAKTELTETLIKKGIKIFYEHKPENCHGAEVIVYSSAIDASNPEIKYAQDHKIPVIPRAEMLGELMRMKFSIAISGTHGKTTVTSLIGSMLEHAEFNPTVIIGGRVLGTEAGAKLGQDYLVAEADESDRSFLLLHPTIAVITNIEREHLDYYKNLSAIKKAFIEFANKVPFFGSVILGVDCPTVRKIIPNLKRECITYGLTKSAQVRAENIRLFDFKSQFDLHYNGEVEEFTVNLPGLHNVQNALATICVGLKLEVPILKIKETLANFAGVHRRLELKGKKNGIVIYDDYGHHPTEIKATLATLRHAYPASPIYVIFQPHRYTRTMYLAKDFANSFDSADVLILTKIYPASEPPIANVSSQLIIDAIQSKNTSTKKSRQLELIYKENFQEIVDYLLTRLNKNVSGDIVILTLGAGNIWQVGDELLKHL